MKLTMLAITTAMALTAIAAAPATAETATFEGFGDYVTPADGYAGVNWQNIFTVPDSYNPNSGYAKGIVSGTHSAYNGFGELGTVSSPTAFTFNDGYFTGAWNDGLTVTVTGFVGGVSTYADVFTVNTSGPTFRTFNWTNLSSVSFLGVGGTDAGSDGGSGEHIAFENLRFNEAVTAAVPEPATWGMMLVGFGMIGFGMRRRASVRTAVRFA